MDSWKTITKGIKQYLDKHPEAPFDITINGSAMCGKEYKVSVSVYLQPEDPCLEVDGIGIEHKKTFTCRRNADR